MANAVNISKIKIILVHNQIIFFFKKPSLPPSAIGGWGVKPEASRGGGVAAIAWRNNGSLMARGAGAAAR